MTCIVGVVEGGRVYIGGDSAGVGGWDLAIRADQKVVRRGEYVFGFTTSYRMGQLLRFKPDLPPPPERDVYEFMATEFIDATRKILRDGGFMKIESHREEGGDYLVGCRGRLFSVSSDFQVGETVAGYDAVGSGANIARGALTVTRAVAPQKRVRLALAAAEQWNAGVRGPFKVVSV